MEDTIKDALEQYISDIDDLKKATNYSQNELWRKHTKDFLNKLNISNDDMTSFDNLANSMIYATSHSSVDEGKYDSLKFFFKLLLRKPLDYKRNSDSRPQPITVQPVFLPSQQNSQKFDPVRLLPTAKISDAPNKKKNKIFIVHGHDDQSKSTLDEMLKEMGFETIILHQKANEGKTIIEKLEKYADDVAYAFILLTPDDMGGRSKTELNPRARQNVILELGYFFGKLGRENVCCLHKSNIELPSDMHGILYIRFENSPEECHRQILKELKNAGYDSKS